MDERCPDHSAHERAIKTHDKRVDAHGEQLDALNETLAALREIEKQNQQRIDGIERRVSNVEAKPGEWWETLAKQAIVVVVAAVVGYALGFIGL